MADPKTISFTTDDGVVIYGNYFESVPASDRCVLMLHMMPETSLSWAPLAGEVVKVGINVLAIDERGHGESVNTTDGGKIDFRNFTDTEQQAKIFDVEAAVRWINGKGIRDISIVGASIGANLAIRYAADHEEIGEIVAMAPGLDYRGVMTEEAVGRMSASQAVLFVGAKDDVESLGSIGKLSQTGNVKKETLIYESGGHGTRLFGPHPEVIGRIVDFLKQ